MKVKAVYFDLDGTLVDSEQLHALSWNRVLADFAIHYDEAEFCSYYAGKPTLEAAKTIKQEHQLAISATELAKQKHDVFAEMAKQKLPRLIDGAKELLAWCQESGLKCALVTGSAKSEAEAILTGYNLHHYFDVIFTRDDVLKPKPDPEPYLKAIEALGVDACQGIALEDTRTGSLSASGAGLFTIVVPNNYASAHDFSHVDHQSSSLFEVKEVIASKLD